jgi:hypothetical protein
MARLLFRSGAGQNLCGFSRLVTAPALVRTSSGHAQGGWTRPFVRPYAFGPLARGAEIDEVAHAKFGGTQIYGLGILACVVWKNYADTVTLDHGN